MLNSLLNPCLVHTLPGRPAAKYPLVSGTLGIGRDKENAIALADRSVSRRHAELVVTDDSVRIVDLASRNGVRVNGMPRKEAALQDGDRVAIGNVELVFSAKAAAAPAAPLQAQQQALEPRQTDTVREALRLPDVAAERHLAAFYHLCSWVTEGVEEPEGLGKWLDLAVESLRAGAVQYYDSANALAHVVLRDEKRPRIKFAPYLLERFRALPEATAYQAKELDRFQERLGQFQYLVAPVRPVGAGPATDPAPVIVALRSADWEPFSASDRVLLQCAVQLWVRSGARAHEIRALRSENRALRACREESPLLGRSAAVQTLRARLERVAATKATVLITGETGSGKEVAAHFLHHHSPRADQPFIKVNCASVPPALMESELFGHLRGAFTDARADHKGRFLLANGGTLFLDEIGELPANVQAKLLRVLETGEVERLGSERPDRVDVRILAATNRDLRDLVRAGTFREDLLYRLEVAKVVMPPLREHPEDIDDLAPHFLRLFCQENGLAELALAQEALAALRNHRWPGNVRELRNVIHRLALEATAPVLTRAAVAAVMQA